MRLIFSGSKFNCPIISDIPVLFKNHLHINLRRSRDGASVCHSGQFGQLLR